MNSQLIKSRETETGRTVRAGFNEKKTEQQPAEQQPTERERGLLLELFNARMEKCEARDHSYTLQSQLLNYMIRDNQKEREGLLKLRAELTGKSGANKDQASSSEVDEQSAEQLDPLRKFTREQAVIIAGYTGTATCKPFELRNDISTRKGKKLTNAAMKKLTRQELEELYKADFQKLCPVKNPGAKARLTPEQAVIVTGYTGKLLGDVGEFYLDLEKRLGRKIVNSELPSIGQEKISELYREDFLMLV
ncbi:hypothetical protein RZO85_27355 [Raoultella ornithinolytica]|uniref:DUF7736 domain-containing protein n=1 Tax=Raoultella ornithinolytica TaxID=54291 RepID=UPI00292ADFBD|nr:hypothetical protein [Raoultella ornithinolytica]MDV0603385.1 hypothetical protein [Raoultella ornithinolytica]